MRSEIFLNSDCDLRFRDVCCIVIDQHKEYNQGAGKYQLNVIFDRLLFNPILSVTHPFCVAGKHMKSAIHQDGYIKRMLNDDV